jgi:hypothetical protein
MLAVPLAKHQLNNGNSGNTSVAVEGRPKIGCRFPVAEV